MRLTDARMHAGQLISSARPGPTRWNHWIGWGLLQFCHESESYPLRYAEHHLAMVRPAARISGHEMEAKLP